MKNRKYFGLVFFVVLAILGFLLINKNGVEKPAVSLSSTYSDQNYPLSFSYNNGLDKYAFFVDKYIKAARKSEPNLLRMLVLVEEGENQKLAEDIKNGVAREGPRGITIFVIKNQQKQALSDWLNKSPISNFGQKIGEVAEISLSGKPALSYQSDGLYINETVAMMEGEYVYVFNVTFNSIEDNIYKDFHTLLGTVNFNFR